MTKTRDLADLGGGFIQAGTGALQRTVESKLQDVVSVLDFIPESEHAAIKAGTSTYNATAAIQAAIDATSAAGKSLFLPNGRYRVTAPLIVKTNLTVVGEDWPRTDTTKGTWVWFDHSGVGFNCSTYISNADFIRFGTYRNQPSPSTSPFTPSAHDWDFRLRGDDIQLAELTLLNPTKGVVLLEGGRLTIENLRGEPLTTGILINSASDTTRVHNIHFWPFWSAGLSPVQSWKTANATAFYSKRNDNPKWENLFCYAYFYGLRFGRNDSAISGFGVTGTTYSGLFSQVNIDYAIRGVYFDSDVDAATINFSQLYAGGNWPTADSTSYALFETAGNNCKVSLNGCGLFESGLELIKAGGTGNRIDINGLSSGGFAYVSPNTAFAINAQSGNTVNVQGYWNMVDDPSGSPRTPTYSANVNTASTIYKSVAGNSSSPQFIFAGTIPLFTQQTAGVGEAGFRLLQPGAREFKTVIPVSDATYNFIDVTGGNLARYQCDSAGTHIFLGQSTTTTTARLVIDSGGWIRPGADNTQSMGIAPYRWSEIFAGTGTINTSDEREKQDISDLSDAELRVATALKGLVKKYRFKNAVQGKGDDARIHVGVIAQDVIAAFQAEGLDAMRYGIVCYDQWPAELDENGAEVNPAGDLYGIRYEELLAFIIAAL